MNLMAQGENPVQGWPLSVALRWSGGATKDRLGSEARQAC